MGHPKIPFLVHSALSMGHPSKARSNMNLQLRISAGAITAIALLWWASHPVMLRFPSLGHRHFNPVLFGPLRDRAPEAVANTFLEAMRAGHCTQLLHDTAVGQSEVAGACAREQEHPLSSWKLADRRDEQGLVWLEYSCPSQSGGWLEIQLRHQQETWRIYTYGRVF
jgi:hypothetical protein